MPLTYQPIPGGGLWIPRPQPWTSNSPGFTAGVTHTGTTEADHYILQVPKTGTLKGFGFRVNAISTPNTVRCGFQTVSLATGLGDGIFDEFVDVASGSLTTGWFDTS